MPSLHPWFAALGLSLVVWGCSEAPSSDIRTTSQLVSLEQVAEIERIFSFEDAGDWETSAPESQSILHTEGAYSLSVTSTGWTTIVSDPLPPLSLDEIGSYVGVDFFHQNTGWGGEVILQFKTDTQWGLEIGRKSLAELAEDEWHSLRFELSPEQRALLSGQQNLQIRLIYNGAQDTIYFDRFDMDLQLEVDGTGGTSGTGGNGSGGSTDVDVNEKILGFEAQSFGGRGSFEAVGGNAGALSSFEIGAPSTEGQHSLKMTVTSADDSRVTTSFVTPKLTSISQMGDTFGLDVLIHEPRNEIEHGYIKVYVDSADAGLYNDWVGQARLDGFFAAGGFRRAQFPLPGHIQSKLAAGGYDDLRFRFELSDVFAGTYSFDWLALRQQFPPVVPPAPSKDIDDVLSFENLNGWTITGTSSASGGSPNTQIGVLSDEDVHGNYSLCLTNFQTANLKSHNLSTLSSTKETLSLTITVPEELAAASASWTLGINAFVSVPSQGIWKSSLGYQGIGPSGLSVVPGSPEQVEFPIPTDIREKLANAAYGDLTVEFDISLSNPVEACILLDDVDLGQQRFEDSVLAQTVTRHFDVELHPQASLDRTVAYHGQETEVARTYLGIIGRSSLLGAGGADLADVISVSGASIGGTHAKPDPEALARVGNVYQVSNAPSYLSPQSSVVSFHTGGSFSEQFGEFEALFPEESWHPVTLLPWTYKAPVARSDDPDIDSKNLSTLSPGRYGRLRVRKNDVLTLDGGMYSFRGITVDSDAELHVANTVATRVFVRGNVAVQGSVTGSNESSGNVWWIQVQENDLEREEYVRQDYVFSIRNGKFFGNVLADDFSLDGNWRDYERDVVTGSSMRGSVYSYGGLHISDSTLVHVPAVTTQADCRSCEFTLGCSGRDLLDQDADSRSDCEENADAFGWTDVARFNGMSVSIGSAGVLDLAAGEQLELEDLDQLKEGADKTRQYYGLLRAPREVPGLSPLLPGVPNLTAAGKYVYVNEGYVYPEFSGHHCFNVMAERGGLGALFVDGEPVARAQNLFGAFATEEEELGCVSLDAGPHFIQYAGVTSARTYYCFGGTADCTPRLTTFGAEFRPSMDGLGTATGDLGYIPGTTEVACGNDPTVCTELCPCQTNPCDDGNACTVDVCIPGQELHLPVSTEDGDPCTLDVCDPILGVSHNIPESDNVCTSYVGCGSDEEPIFESFTSALTSEDACTVNYCEDGEAQSRSLGVNNNPCVQSQACDPVTGVIGATTFKAVGTACGWQRTCDGVGNCRVADETVTPFSPSDSNITLDERFNSPSADSSCAVPFVAPDPEQYAVVSGLVMVREGMGAPIARKGAKVSIVGSCQYGYTTTRADGRFYMPVQGGGTRVIRISNDGYLTSDRSAQVETGGGDDIGMVVLIRESEAVLEFDSTEAKIVTAPPVIDVGSNNKPQGTPSLFLPQGVEINGQTTGEIRITPFTQGPVGPLQMPADLPPGTDYTHAFEVTFNDDESAVIENGSVAYYYDSFMSEGCDDSDLPSGGALPQNNRFQTAGTYDEGNGPLSTGTGTCADYQVGKPVPNFFYNRATGRWEREKNNGSIIVLHCNDEGELEDVLGIYDSELLPGELDSLAAEVGGNRSCGQKLMRTVIHHFSPYDLNWLRRAAADVRLADLSAPNGAFGEVENQCGSVIGVESRTLGESIDLPGVDQRLHYNSSAMFGHTDNYDIGEKRIIADLDLTASWNVPGVATKLLPTLGVWPTDWQSPAVNEVIVGPSGWSGLDEEGRRAYGLHRASLLANFWARLNPGGGTSVGGGYWFPVVAFDVDLSVYDAAAVGLGGWTLSGHHTLQTNGEQVAFYRGDVGRSQPKDPTAAELILSRSDMQRNHRVPSGEFEVTNAGNFFTNWIPSGNNRGREVVHIKQNGQVETVLSYQSPVANVIDTSTLAYDPLQNRLFVARVNEYGQATDYQLVMITQDSNSGTWTPSVVIPDLRSKPRGLVVRSDGRLMIALDHSGGCPLPQPNQPEIGCYQTELFEVDENLGKFSVGLKPVLGWESDENAIIEPIPDVPDGIIVGYARLEAYRIMKWTPIAGIEPLLWNSCNAPFREGMPAAHFNLGWYGTGTAGNTQVRLDDILPLPGGRVLFTGDGSGSNRLDGAIYELYPSEPAGTPDCSATNPPTEGVAISMRLRRFAGDGCEQGDPESNEPTCLGGFGISMGQNPDGSIVLRQNTPQGSPVFSKIYKVRSLDDVREQISEDGQEVFIFSKDGSKHLRTVDARDRSVVLRSFDYDEAGFLESIDEGGLLTTIERGDTQATITGPNGQQTVIEFDSSGYASEILRNANGASSDRIELTHDVNGMLVRMKDGDGTHSYEYSPRGHLVYDGLIANDEGAQATFQTLAARLDSDTYTSYQNFTNGAGETSAHEYTNGTGQSARTVLDSQGVGYELTTDGKETTVVSTDGARSVTTWGINIATGANSPMSVATTIGNQTVTHASVVTAIPTGWNEKTTVRGPGDSSARDLFEISTNTEQNLVVARAPSGVKVSSWYDDAGRTTKTQVGDLLPQRLEYTSGRLSAVQQVEADGSESSLASYAYLSAGAQGSGYLGTLSTPVGSTSFSRDDYGRPLSSTQDTVTTEFDYDWAGRLSQVIEPGSGEHNMSFTAHGLMTSYEPPSHSATTTTDIHWVYDAARRVEHVYLPVSDGEVREIGYRRDGTQLPFPGRLRGIDLLDSEAGNRTIDLVYGDEAFIQNVPGADPQTLGKPGQLYQVTTPSLKTRYGWNGPLLISEEADYTATDMATTRVSWNHDNRFRPSVRKLSIDGTESSTATSTSAFDGDSRLRSVTVGGKVISYGYDGDVAASGPSLYSDALVGRTGTAQPHGLLEHAKVGLLTESTSYDDHGRRKTFAVRTNGNIVYQEVVDARDLLGRVKTRTEYRPNGSGEVEGITTEYTYDARGQLKSSQRGAEPTKLYEYDANGNRECTLEGMVERCETESEFFADGTGDNQLSSTADYDYTYNAAGQLATKSAMGEVTSYVYDVLGALQSVQTQTDQGAVVEQVSYLNDFSGRRVRRSTSSGDFAQYVWGNSLQIEALLDATGTLQQRYIYGLRPNVPELIVRRQGSITSTYRVVTDQLGSPLYLINVDDGSVWMSATYDDWGNATGLTIDGTPTEVSAWPIPFGYAGGLFDSATGLVRFGARDYDPSVGRWTAKDPILFGGGQTNLYIYVGNDPVNFVDYEGRFRVSAEFAQSYPKATQRIHAIQHSLTAQHFLAYNTFGGATDRVIREAFRNEGGPEVIPSVLYGKSGEFDDSRPDEIVISQSLFANFENGTESADWFDRVILHEMAHYFDALDGRDFPGEEGEFFEKACYGSVLTR